MNTNKSNRYNNANLIGKRVILKSGLSGTVDYAGYDLITITLDVGHWICGAIGEIDFKVQF